MFWTQPTCPACGYEGPQFMYLPHGNWEFHALIQDRQTLALRTVAIPNGCESLRFLDDLPEVERDRAWARRVTEIADPPLSLHERVVPIGEFMDAAVQRKPTAAELPCPKCRSPLYWQHCGIS